MKCPTCGFDSQPEMQFCGRCGTRLVGVCPECGFVNPPDHRFCGMCGARLSEEVIPEQPPGSPEEAEETISISAVPPLERSPVSEVSMPVLVGERRQATIVLADLKGSTDLLERIGTEAWVEVMNRVLQLLESEIYRFGGEVDQFRGDGLVAFFGATSAHEDDPERAVMSALAMQTALKPCADELAEREGVDLLLRVGVNTGEVIVASIGDRRQYSEDTAMGEAIALAARMEAAAEPGTVLVSENSYRLVQSQFEWQSLGEITVKGMRQPIAVYQPLAPRAEVTRIHDPQTHGLPTLLIGLETEFQALKRYFEDLRVGRGGIVMVTGDKGLGKSRLVAEVHQHLIRDEVLLADARIHDRPPKTLQPPLRSYSEQDPEDGSDQIGVGNQPHLTGMARDHEADSREPLTWLEGRCRSYSQSSPYSMWRDLLQRWLGVLGGERDTETRDRLYRLSEMLWGDQLVDYYPYLATLLSLPLEETYTEWIKHLDAEGLRHQLFLAVRSWVEAMVIRGPLVMTFADVHWADTTSLDLLRYCLPLCDHEALLWLIVFRSDRASPVWEFHHHVETEYPHRATTLTLTPLTEAQSGEFIDRLIGPEVLPAETRTLVVDKAEGNPYYIEELIRSLVTKKVLKQDVQTGRWQVTRAVDSLDLPETLQNLLMARIDNLSPEVRRVLQMAAVIGSVFWSDVLQDMAGDGATLRGHLTALQRAQLIHERRRVPDLGTEYVFKSTLIRDVAYESILKTQRIAYHRQIADHLAQLFGEEIHSQRCSLVAYHYRCAKERGKELFYTRFAAEQAQGIYANAEAIQLFNRALELLNELERQDEAPPSELLKDWRLETLRGLGQIHFGIGEVGKAEGYFREAIALGREMELEPHALVRLFHWLGEVLFWQNRYDEHICLGEEGLTLLGDDTESVEAALMNQTIAIGHSVMGNEEKFQEFTYRTAQFIQSLPYSQELRPAYDHIVLAHINDKNLDESMKWIQALERKADQHHDLRASGEVHLYTAYILIEKGDLREAISMLENGLDMFRRIGDAKHASWCLRRMVQAYLRLGDIQKAEKYAYKELETTEAVGIKGEIAAAYWDLGWIYLCQGIWDKAIEAFEKVVQLMQEIGIWVWRMKEFANYAIGRVYLARGDYAKALRQFKTLIPEGPEILRTNPSGFVHLLNGLELAYKRSRGFHTFSHHFREEHPEISDSPFIQWFLEPTDVGTVHGPPLLHEEFAESLSADWVTEDPFGDCSFVVQDGLEIHAANGRDLWINNMSAPRILCPVLAVTNQIEGADFAAQTVCTQVCSEKPAIGGILLWRNRENWLRLDRGTLCSGEISFRGCLGNEDRVIGRGCLPLDSAGGSGQIRGTQDKPSQRVYLRLERLGRRVNALCSADGEEWFTVGYVEFPDDSPVRVGLYAIGYIDHLVYHGAYPDGTAIRFESFHLWEM